MKRGGHGVFCFLEHLFRGVLIVIGSVKFLRCSQRERNLRDFIDKAGLACFRFSLNEGRILFSNEVFVNMLELDDYPGGITGCPLMELFISAEGYDELRFMLADRGHITGIKYEIRTLKGTNKTLSLDAYLEASCGIKEKKVMAVLRDVTGIEAFLERNAGYGNLFRNSGDMMFIFDLFGMEIKEVNPSMVSLSGFTEKDLLCMRATELIHPLDREKFEKKAEDTAFSQSETLETIMVCKGGAYKEVLFAFSIADIEGKKRILALAKDISRYARRKEETEAHMTQLEDFWKASIEREERIHELREALTEAGKKIKELEKKNDKNG